MARIPQVIKDLKNAFSKEIQNVPEGFYDTYNYTKTGNNLTHPRTLGYIVKVIWELEIADCVDLDLRINLGNRRKFQPDVFTRKSSEEVLVVDYESPNSSDARIPEKDVEAYLNWNHPIPYVIITTLPKKKRGRGEWELRYSSRGYWNEDHIGKLEDIRKNPFRYWYTVYRKELKRYNGKLNNVCFLNINGKKVSIEKFR